MSDARRIVWLASYPKSGNTWTRIFLANYLVNGDKPVPINQAHRFAMGDAVSKTYDMVAGRHIDGRETDVVLGLRAKVLRGIVANGADVNFVKTHNLYGSFRGIPLIPKEFTKSSVYIVRNPLDVVLSYARHFGCSHDLAAASLANPGNSIAPTEHTVGQYLGRWDSHATGWTRDIDHPHLVLRYEDLLSDAEGQFTKLLAHIGIPVDGVRLKKAIKFSSFSELAGQESRDGFEEKSDHTKAFFSRGEAGQWKQDLAQGLIDKIRADHGTVMKKFGYLDE